MRALRLLVALSVVQIACQAASHRYIVSVKPIDVGVPPGLCVAVDPNDPKGVWWWDAGPQGCSTRSTGPGLFHPVDATVAAPAKDGPVLVTFRLGTHSESRPFVEVQLAVQGSEMRSIETGSRVPVEYRTALDIPEAR
jgi:hypothetical protein